MGKIILTIGEDYVSDWTVENAIRELIQNKIDQEATDSNNIGSIEVSDGVLTISNKTSKLTRSSLILGCSSKQGDNNTIGKFGEGYKLALLVLLREGYNVYIYNLHENEIWVPAIEYVEEFDSNLLVINTKSYDPSQMPNNNLSFVIEGLDDIPELLDEIILVKDLYTDIIDTKMGEILIGESSGNIYVNSLYVTYISDLKHSYNFKPNYLNIGRDRNLADKFDIQMKTRDIWSKVADTHEEVILDMIKNKASDVYALKYGSSSAFCNIVNKLQEDLGNKVPICNEVDKKEAKELYGPNVQTIIVSEQEKAIVGPRLQSRITRPKAKSKSELMDEFYDKHKKQFTKAMTQDWNKLVKKDN